MFLFPSNPNDPSSDRSLWHASSGGARARSACSQSASARHWSNSSMRAQLVTKNYTLWMRKNIGNNGDMMWYLYWTTVVACFQQNMIWFVVEPPVPNICAWIYRCKPGTWVFPTVTCQLVLYRSQKLLAHPSSKQCLSAVLLQPHGILATKMLVRWTRHLHLSTILHMCIYMLYTHVYVLNECPLLQFDFDQTSLCLSLAASID